MTATISLDICTPEGKTWLAELIGTGGRYGLEREFVSVAARDTSRSGKTGTATYHVGDGIYEANEGRRRYGRSYYIVTGGEARAVERDEAIEALS